MSDRVPNIRGSARTTTWRLVEQPGWRAYSSTQRCAWATHLRQRSAVDWVCRSTSMTSGLALSQLTGFFGIITGPMADGWGRRRMMLAGMTMLAGGMLVAAAHPTFVTVLMALFLAGFGKTFFDPALKAYVGDWIPYERRGAGHGRSRVLLGSESAVRYATRRPVDKPLWMAVSLLLLGAAGLVSAASILLLFPRGRLRAQYSVVAAGLLSAWQHLAGEPAALWVLASSVLVAAANLALFVVYGAWMEQSFSLSIVALGTTGLLIGLSELLGESLTALTSDRIGLKHALLIGSALLVGSYCLLPWFGHSLSMAWRACSSSLSATSSWSSPRCPCPLRYCLMPARR